MLDQVISAVQFICTAAAGLSGFAALVIYGASKLSPESQTGTADVRLMACIIAAVAFAAAGILIGQLELNYGG